MKRPDIRSSLGRAAGAMRRWPLLAPTGRGRGVALILSLLVLAGTSTQLAIAWATALPGNAVLRAHGVVISEDEFRQRVDVLTALYGLQPPKQGAAHDRFIKDAAKSIAVSMIIDQAAEERKVVIGDKQAQDALSKIIEEQLPGGRQAFLEFLGSHGIAEREVVDEVKRQLATSRLFEQVTADVPALTDKEVRQAYEERKKEMVSPELRQLRNIVVDTKETATSVMEQAKQGADFAQLAAKYSLDRSTKGKGGDLGTVTAGQLDKEFADAAFGAGAVAFFGPVKTQHGWNVGQAVKITPAKRLSFDEVKEQLEAELNNKRTLDTWRGWLAEQIRAADVEYADEYRPADPDAPPADAVPR